MLYFAHFIIQLNTIPVKARFHIGGAEVAAMTAKIELLENMAALRGRGMDRAMEWYRNCTPPTHAVPSPRHYKKESGLRIFNVSELWSHFSCCRSADID